MDQDIIKVLIGQRRVGKSYIFFQLIEELKTKFDVQDLQIIVINKELHEFDHIQDYKDLLVYIKNHTTQPKTYVFIDEIQDIDEFEKALRDLQAQ